MFRLTKLIVQVEKDLNDLHSVNTHVSCKVGHDCMSYHFPEEFLAYSPKIKKASQLNRLNVWFTSR